MECPRSHRRCSAGPQPGGKERKTAFPSGKTGLPVMTAVLRSHGENTTAHATRNHAVETSRCRRLAAAIHKPTAMGSATMGTAVYLHPHAKPATTPPRTIQRRRAGPQGKDIPRRAVARDAIPKNSRPFSTYARLDR